MKQVPTSDNKTKRDAKGRLLPGNTANPNGRPVLTEGQKLEKKAVKEFIEEHKETLAEALPKIAPVLINKAIKGHVLAIKEVHDRVMGRPNSEDEPKQTTNYLLQVIQNIINEPNRTIIGENFRTVENDESTRFQIERQDVEIKQPVHDNQQARPESSVQTKQATDLLTGKPTL